jgi:hypothetical protein
MDEGGGRNQRLVTKLGGGMGSDPMNPDSEKIYDEQIFPLMEQIIAICKEHKIPMVASFQWCGEGHLYGAGLCTTRIPFEGESSVFDTATTALTNNPAIFAFSITSD